MTSEFWSIVAVSSFWCWVGTFLLFIFKAFPRLSVFQSRPALVWGSISFFCFVLWVVALRSA
jgi:hypothetical protein